MKVTVEWLKEYIATDATPDEIGAELTMLGIELEAIENSELGPVLDFKVTPNRGDCLSVLGIARELAAKDVIRYRPTELFTTAVAGWPATGEARRDDIVEIEAVDSCPRYAARLFSDIDCSAPSSDKVRKRLTACGMRPISIVVDTTNYVMLELGQPLHAFDRERLSEQRIVVRTARPGEAIKTLDGADRKLTPDMLLICDAEKPVAIAGVMGGESSEVDDRTKSILLESAHFDPISVRKTRRALGMSTEASYRFERFVDPEGVVRALNRFAHLLREQTGAEADPILCDCYPGRRAASQIRVRESRWNRLLGVEVPIAAAASLLQALGCAVTESDGTLSITPPSWRPDLLAEEDLIEEVGRLWGYERIPEALPSGATPQGGESADAALRTAARNAMLRLGFTEMVNHTLSCASPLDPSGASRIELRNPAAPELALLRASLLPGLAQSAAKNRGRALHTFEIGRVFSQNVERRSLAFLMSGRLLPEDWSDNASPTADFFSAKGVVEELASLLARRVTFSQANDPRLHPTRQAAIQGIGILGEIQPSLADDLDIQQGTLLAELDLDALQAMPAIRHEYAHLSPYPSVRRDMAFLIAKSASYDRVIAAIEKAVGPILEDAWLFDRYEGKGVPEGMHSLAIAIVLRHQERTMTDDEANSAREAAFQALQPFGAQRR
jgi:phenylalanyl-tRNA synthetase beta chain